MHVRSLFSKKANTDDLGPLSFDSFRKNNLSASWKFSGQEDLIPHEIVETDKKRTPTGKEEKTFDVGQSQYVDRPAKLARRVKVREAGTDWGWGVVVNVVKKPAPPLGSLPPGLSSSRSSSYIVDISLHCSIGSSESGSRPSPCPPRSGQKGQMYVLSHDFQSY